MTKKDGIFLIKFYKLQLILHEKLKMIIFSFFDLNSVFWKIFSILTLPVLCISGICIETKINLNFYLHTSLWCLKRFYESYICNELTCSKVKYSRKLFQGIFSKIAICVLSFLPFQLIESLQQNTSQILQCACNVLVTRKFQANVAKEIMTITACLCTSTGRSS